MSGQLCKRCELHTSKKRLVIKLDNYLNPEKIYLCDNCYYKILRELNIGGEK